MALRTASKMSLFQIPMKLSYLIKSSDSSTPLIVNLTLLATLRANGTIPGDEELKRQSLHL